MSLIQQLDHELAALQGQPSKQMGTVLLTDPAGVDVEIDFTAVDSMSASFRELRLNVPKLAGQGVDPLEKWARALSSRVTYLLEALGPIEIDRPAGNVLVRSNPPDQQPDGTRYYEILLESNTAGSFTLRRYEAVKGQSGRTPVDIQTTHEVLRKLLADLVDTIP